MKGVPLIATLICGLVSGWVIHSFLYSPNSESGRSGNNLAGLSPALESSPASVLEGQADAPQLVALRPGQSQEEILKTARGILRDPNHRRRMRNFLVLLDGLTSENADVLRKMFASAPESSKMAWAQYQSFFFQRWGEISGEAAVRATTDGMPGESDLMRNMRAAIVGWASQDLEAALRFAETLPDGTNGRETANAALLGILIKADLNRAAEFVFKQPNASQNEAALRALFQEAESQQRPELFQTWFEQVSDPPTKGVLAAKTVEFLRAKSFEEAVEFVTNAGDAPWRNWDMYWPVASDYAKRDPKAALEWVISLPKFPDEPAPPGLAAVTEHWYAQQPAAAKEWVMQNLDQPWWPRAARGIMVSLKDQGNGSGLEQFLAEFTPEGQRAIQEDAAKPKPVIPMAPQ